MLFDKVVPCCFFNHATNTYSPPRPLASVAGAGCLMLVREISIQMSRD